MLSTNSNLHQDCYRIIRYLWSDSARSLYEARDTIRDQDVVICEFVVPDGHSEGTPNARSPLISGQELFDHLRSFSHPSIVGVQAYFSEAGHHYLVSNPIAGTNIAQWAGLAEPTFELFDVEYGLREIFAAISLPADSGKTTCLGVTPATIWITPEREFKWLYFGPGGRNDEHVGRPGDPAGTGFAFLPLENIWDGLDRASQNTIANTYDDGSLDVLVSAPDFRSDMFTIGAIFYSMIAGRPPVDALERSIEILDGNQDPLIPPHLIDDSASPEISEFIMKLMRLRREDRFDSVDRAYRQLAAIRPVRTELPRSPFEVSEDADLLEIPAMSYHANREFGGRATFEPIVSTTFLSPTASGPNDYSDAGRTGLNPEVGNAASYGLNGSADRSGDHANGTNGAQFLFGARLNETDNPSAYAPRRHWLLSPVPITVLVLILLGVSAGAMFYLKSADNNGTESQSAIRPLTVANNSVRSEPAEVPNAKQISTAPADSATLGDREPDPAKETQPSNPAVPAPVRNRPQIADTRQPRKAEGPAGATSVPKKKVTVDDLIKDN